MANEQWKPLIFKEFEDVFNELSENSYMEPEEYLKTTDDSFETKEAVDLLEYEEQLKSLLQPFGSADGDTEQEISTMLKQTPGVISSHTENPKTIEDDPLFKLDESILNVEKFPILLNEKFFALPPRESVKNYKLESSKIIENCDDDSKSLQERFPSLFPNLKKMPSKVQDKRDCQYRPHLSNVEDIITESIAISDSDDDDVEIVSVTEGNEKSQSSHSQSDKGSYFPENKPLASNKHEKPFDPRYYTPRAIYDIKRQKD